MHHYFKHIGDLNINPLDFKNKKFQGLINLIFDDGMVSAINKTACVARHATTAFDLVFTKSIINTGIKSTIVKTDISDHFSNEISLIGPTEISAEIRSSHMDYENISYAHNRFLDICLSLFSVFQKPKSN